MTPRDDQNLDHIPTTNADSPVQPAYPIELFIERDVLAAILRDHLHHCRLNRLRDFEDEEHQVFYDAALQLREDFLAWVESQENPAIFCILSPTSEFVEPVGAGDDEEDATPSWE